MSKLSEAKAKQGNAIADIDMRYCNDSLCWKSGGDGDNGEMLMYALDIYLECQDANEAI